MVGDLIEAEIIPFLGRDKRVDFNLVVSAGSETDEAGDDEVAEGGMIVVFAALDFAFS